MAVNESLLKEITRRRTELSTFYNNLDEEDERMVSKLASETYETKEEQEAFIKGYLYSKEQPPAKVIHRVAMYVFDYVKDQPNYHYIVKQIYELLRKVQV